MKFKNLCIWGLGFIITLSAAVYQRKSGPTYPYSETINLNEKNYKIQLIRTHSSTKDAKIILPITDTAVKAKINYRIYPTKDDFAIADFTNTEEGLEVLLPKQLPAGKLEYFIELTSNNKVLVIPSQIIRYKGDVPAFWLIPHILFMFLAMFFSNVAGLQAVFGLQQFKRQAWLTISCLFGGGIIFGPVVQKFAFGEFWTGVPFGWDLTDNKTLIAFIFWLLAILFIKRKNSTLFTIIASAVMLVIFAIPHSMFGSQLDPESGKVVQGIILLSLMNFKANKVSKKEFN